MSDKVIVNDWQHSGQGIRMSQIIDRAVSCEDIDVCRYAAEDGAVLDLASDKGHILSLIEGKATIETGDQKVDALCLTSGVHLYLPPGCAGHVRFSRPSLVIHASAPGHRQHGSELLVHNERYLASTRFVLTPQYLSRRAFLQRDHTLVSGSGDRVAWFHTTMFDTQGLPSNIDGKSVFKMSYDNQTEVNVIYEVRKQAAVRFADHPYTEPTDQSWSDWYALDGETTYYLNEGADRTGHRNRHEIYIARGGHVSLCCMFDPGPTGLETHQPGAYSSYAPVNEVVGTKTYREYLASVAGADEIIRSLSLAEACNGGVPDRTSTSWAEYKSAYDQALTAEDQLIRSSDEGRRAIMASWRIEKLFGSEPVLGDT